MTEIQKAILCRICFAPEKEAPNSYVALLDPLIDRKSPAELIEFCFSIVVLANDMGNKICLHCKTELENAYRFVLKLRQLDSQQSECILEIDQSKVTADGIISSDYIAEIEVKTESADGYHSSSKSEEILEELNVLEAENPNSSDYIKYDPALHDATSGDDSDSNDEEQNSSDEDHDYGRPQRKRLYYGVKSDSRPKRCCSCKEPLDSKEKVRDHSEMYHQSARVTNPKEYGDKIFECPVCFQRFETKKLYLQHQRKMYVEVLHPCSKCEEEFANLYVLKKHIKVAHKKKFILAELEELRRKSNICCACKKNFSTSEALKLHVDKVHYPEQILCETNNTFECNVCYHRFKTYKSLKHHQLRFYREKKFVCTVCGKAFREKIRLSEHENSHRKIRKFQCALCPAKFAIKNSYDVHVKMHDAEECFNCEFCGKGFRKKSLLVTHLQTHSKERPFKCHLCPNTFTRQNILDSHLLAHSDSKPFKCQQCTASYIHQRDLRRHIREKHEGIRSFKCSLCPKAYIRKKLLTTHMKSHEI